LVAAPSSSTAAAPPDHAADAAFKLVGNAGQDGAPILGGAQLHRLPLGPHPRRLGQMILEHLEASGHPPDLVVQIDEWNVPAREPRPLGQRPLGPTLLRQRLLR